MSPDEFLARLRHLGVQLWLDGERLRYRAPEGVLTPELRAELATRKAEVCALLAEAKAAVSSPVPLLRPVPRDQALPLSFAQQRQWIINRLEPDSPVYNIPVVVRLSGLLAVHALEASINEIVRRHEVLRTTFAVVEGLPVQVIAPALVLALPVIDLVDRAAGEREIEARRLATQAARERFDLACGPLIRATLLRLQSDEHWLLFTIHHIVSDGWSAGVLTYELGAVYEAFRQGQPSPLPDLPIQYADFAVWQRNWLLAEGELERQLAYWQAQLAQAPPLLELPTDYARPPVKTYAGASHPFVFSEELSDALRAFSAREGVTLFMALLAAFAAWLQRCTGQADIVVGSPVANRTQVELETLIGFFVNTLTLRIDLSGNPSFRELLARVRETSLGAYAHQDVPFEVLVERLRPERDLSRTPLFQTMFVLQNAPAGRLDLAGLTLSSQEIDSQTAMFDLTLAMVDTPQGFRGVLEYSTDLFARETIERWEEHYQRLLVHVIAHPEQRLADIPLLTEAETRQLLNDWNPTSPEADPEREPTLLELLAAQAERTPAAVAVVCEGRSLTYAELNWQSNQLGRYLQAHGVGPEVLVGLCLERSLEAVVGLLGILKAGGVYVPLDANAPSERLAFMLQDTQAPLVLTQTSLVKRLPATLTQRVCVDADWPMIATESAAPLASAVWPTQAAYVIYTSGSTGSPKGVLISHRALVQHCRKVQADYELTPADRVLQFASLSFDASLEQILPPLLAGARLIVRGELMWTPAELCQQLVGQGLTVINVPPGYWHQLAEAWSQTPLSTPETSLRLVIVGGDEMGLPSLRLWQQTPLKAVRLLNAYGPTEATITAIVGQVVGEAEIARAARIPLGRPLSPRTAYLLDAGGRPVPVGMPGELYLGGAGVARGYLNRPDLTAERFVPDPFSRVPGARLYRTGDRMRYRADGTLEFLGRVDHQVKVRGFRIELGEIEAVLLRYPALQDAVVVLAAGVAPGDKRLVAYVVPRAAPLNIIELRNFLKEKLPDYMVPAVLVALEKLPRLPSGKVNRQALPAPDGLSPNTGVDYVAPQTDLERLIAQVWQAGLHLEQVGLHDNFFDLGGHSLLLIQVHSQLQETLGRELRLITLFQYPTIAALARFLGQTSGAASTAFQHGRARAQARQAALQQLPRARRPKRS